MKKFTRSKLLIIFLIVAFISLNNFCIASSIREYFTSSTTHTVDFTVLKNTIFTILTWIGWGVAICVTLVTGIQFLTSNSQKKAQLKEKLWLIILGVALLAGGLPLLQLIVNVFQAFAIRI